MEWEDVYRAPSTAHSLTVATFQIIVIVLSFSVENLLTPEKLYHCPSLKGAANLKDADWVHEEI